MTSLPDDAKALLDQPVYATIATIDPDGQPQLSLVWIGRDGDDVLFSTIKGRRKTDNLQRDDRASLLVFPPENPYQYLEIRGSVSLVDDPSASYIDEMANKYLGKDYPWGKPEEQRIIVRLTPAKVVWRA
jgi:PPOX class probable F420-dependent enzyme